MQKSSAKKRTPRLKIGSYSTHDLATAFLFLLPAFVVFIVFKYYPLIENFSIGMTSWDFFGPKHYVGFDNYTRLFKSSTFWKVLGNTFHYTIWSTFLSLLLGMLLAYPIWKVFGTVVGLLLVAVLLVGLLFLLLRVNPGDLFRSASERGEQRRLRREEKQRQKVLLKVLS